MSDPRSSSGWDTILVLGGAAATAILFGLGVAIFVWIGDPLRFGGLDCR